MMYVLLAVGLLVGFALGILARPKSKSNIGVLHVYEDEFDEPNPLLFLELRSSVRALYGQKEVSVSVVIDPRD